MCGTIPKTVQDHVAATKGRISPKRLLPTAWTVEYEEFGVCGTTARPLGRYDVLKAFAADESVRRLGMREPRISAALRSDAATRAA